MAWLTHQTVCTQLFSKILPLFSSTTNRIKVFASIELDPMFKLGRKSNISGWYFGQRQSLTLMKKENDDFKSRPQYSNEGGGMEWLSNGEGRARTQSPTLTNYAPEFPTFGGIAGFNSTWVQWWSLDLKELPCWSQYPLSQVSMPEPEKWKIPHKTHKFFSLLSAVIFPFFPRVTRTHLTVIEKKEHHRLL